MPDTLKKANAENYLLCPTCSQEEGEEVLYPKRALRTERPLFGEARRICPLGHPLLEATT